MRLTVAVRPGLLEITDLLWPTDEHGELLPVLREEGIEALRARGQRRAATILARMPSWEGVIDQAYLRDLALRIHCELSRLGEEMQLARRIAEYLREPIRSLAPSPTDPVTIVDIGCGLGHVLRSAAAHDYFPADVRLIGVDLNRVLIDRASELAAVEQLDVRFVHGDAFDLEQVGADPGRSIVVSSGVLHHLDRDELVRFFAGHEEAGFAGFAHWDIAPCLWSTLGAWAFHQARMREAVSRHDGVMSARRAHSAEVLVEVSRIGAPSYASAVIEGPRWQPRALDVLRPIVGWR